MNQALPQRIGMNFHTNFSVGGSPEGRSPMGLVQGGSACRESKGQRPWIGCRVITPARDARERLCSGSRGEAPWGGCRVTTPAGSAEGSALAQSPEATPLAHGTLQHAVLKVSLWVVTLSQRCCPRLPANPRLPPPYLRNLSTYLMNKKERGMLWPETTVSTVPRPGTSV